MKYTIEQIKKANLEDTFFGMYFYRKIATYFTYFLAKTRLSPNQISILSLTFALLGVLFFSFGGYTNFIIGAILIQIGMILDYSDGQIARLKKLGTRRGAWFDVILGMIQNNLIILGIVLGLYKMSHDIFVFIIGFIVLFAWNMTCYVHLNAMIFFPNLILKRTDLAKKVSGGIKIKPQFFSIGSDVYFVFIGLGAIFSRLLDSLVLLSVLGNIYWIAIALFMFKNTKNVK